MSSGLYLHIGCGNRIIPNFVNIDLEPDADLQLDVTQGLPFGDNTVKGIFSEHFFEHISQSQGCAFLRECRRVLMPGGIVRIATPDLDYCVEKYQTDWRDQDGLRDFNLSWIQNRCEFMNVAMREWGHQWLYNEEELRRVARYAGLAFVARRELNQSDEPMLAGREYRQDSKLICEFEKRPSTVDESNDLVSIVMAVYKPQHFREAIESALAQTYARCEIVIGDDCPTDAITRLVEEYQTRSPKFPIHYKKNPVALVGHNFVQSFLRAQGTYIKFLNDDDTLAPDCVERMVDCLTRYPDVTLVTSHRQRIDTLGQPLPDNPVTTRVAAIDCVLEGTSTCDTIFKVNGNFIGEPSTAMYRKRDLQDVVPNILGYAEREVDGNNDVSWWLNLLGKGTGIYLADSLSTFRVHEGQIQHIPSIHDRLLKSWDQMRFDAHRFAQYKPTSPRQLFARPLAIESSRETRSQREKCRRRWMDQAARSSRPMVSVIVPINENEVKSRRCWNRLERHLPDGFPWEIILIDGGSNTSAAALARLWASRDSRVRILHVAKKVGFFEAVNHAVEFAQGEGILLLEGDAEITPGFLEPLVTTLELNANVGCVGPRVISPKGKIQSAGILFVADPSRPDDLQITSSYAHEPGNSFAVDQRRSYQALSSTCLLVRASAFREVGEFNHTEFPSLAGIDACLVMRARGWTHVFEPESVVVHAGPPISDTGQDIQRFRQKWAKRIIPDVDLASRDPLREVCRQLMPVDAPAERKFEDARDSLDDRVTLCMLPSARVDSESLWELVHAIREVAIDEGFEVVMTTRSTDTQRPALLIGDLDTWDVSFRGNRVIGFDLLPTQAPLVHEEAFDELWVPNERRESRYIAAGRTESRVVPIFSHERRRVVPRGNQEIDLLVVGATPAKIASLRSLLVPSFNIAFLPVDISEENRLAVLGGSKVILWAAEMRENLDPAFALAFPATNHACVLVEGPGFEEEVPGVEIVELHRLPESLAILLSRSGERYQRAKYLHQWIKGRDGKIAIKSLLRRESAGRLSSIS